MYYIRHCCDEASVNYFISSHDTVTLVMDTTSKECRSNMRSSPDFFQILSVVEGLKNGKPIKFIIKKIPKSRYEDAADHMCKYFLAEESMCKSLNVLEDPLTVKEFRNLFRLCLEDGLSVGAFVDNPEDENFTLAGLNVLYRGGKEKDLEFEKFMSNSKSEKVNKIIKSLMMCADVNVEKIYGTENYIGGLGLSVNPSFQGNSLGYHLLLARNEIGKQHGILITTTLFTSLVSAKLADRAGFTILCEKLRDELVDEKGEMLVPNCQTESFKFMGKRLT